MSEPIQAIATNNYLLATQQEVSHDNTLSGNGTSASPLGVNSPWIDITTACTLGAHVGNCSVYANPAARICWLAGAFSPTNTGNFLTVPVEYKWLTYFEAANPFNHYIDFMTNGDGNVASVRDGAGTYWSQTIMWAY